VRNIVIIAGKEIKEGLRNRWVLATTLLLAALSLSLTFLGSAPTGNVGADALDVVVVSLSSLTIFLLPLIALLISHDAVVGEMERGTMPLLLSYPVGRRQVILGKFCGHVLILAFATVIGYGAAAAALAVTGASVLAASWYAFAAMLGTSILLGAVFVAIGYLISSLVRDRGTAAGLSVGIWLLMVLVFDMGLLGILVIDQGRVISAGVLEALLAIEQERGRERPYARAPRTLDLDLILLGDFVLDEPDLGLLVGVDGDRIVTHAACRGFPCPIVVTDVRSGARRALLDDADGAVLVATPEGPRLVSEQRTATGRRLAARPLEDGGSIDLGPLPADLRLEATPVAAGAATTLPPGWVQLTPDGRIPADRTAPRPILRHLPDGLTVPFDEAAR
jgi:Cu-processing system permease protein